jgi:phosphonate transport system permease protein
MSGAPPAESHPSLAPRRPWGTLGVLALLAVVTVVSSRHTGLEPGEVLAALPAFFAFAAANTWPPDFSGAQGLVLATLLTIEVAFLGTLLATVVSVPLALLCARNLTPHLGVLAAVRAVVMACRAVPDFVFALMFVAALGLGPLPGVLGLAIHSVGMLAKVYAERMEEVDPGPSEALSAMGASRIQMVRVAVLPQVVPSLVANTLYRFDINIRSSIILGVVGAGGIGYELVTALQSLDYQRASSVMIIVLVLVVVVEAVSNRIRKRYI